MILHFCDRCGRIAGADADKMRKIRTWYGDVFDARLGGMNLDLVRIEIQGERHECCSGTDCINAFNNFQMKVDATAETAISNLRAVISEEKDIFWKEANPYGEPQEATNGQ